MADIADTKATLLLAIGAVAGVVERNANDYGGQVIEAYGNAAERLARAYALLERAEDSRDLPA